MVRRTDGPLLVPLHQSFKSLTISTPARHYV
jgi:hypothetical protein